ncbi:hypothetical protein EUTSA_v10018451mg [Eutrema salsugineum]|uniref:Uncharacterized protein n=1 Tax=Eutrema salsugineum TaxID=72664 RepID=V4KJ87_EUTSA|nr:hypothetical protein EUTSA_v10018451mg [Eutrema salsugineum]
MTLTFKFIPLSSLLKSSRFILKRTPDATFLRRRRILFLIKSTAQFSPVVFIRRLIASDLSRKPRNFCGFYVSVNEGSMDKSSKCAVCHTLFRASICVACVNRRLNEYKIMLDSLKSRREISYLRLSGLLVTKSKYLLYDAGKSTFRRLSHNLKERYGIIESTNFALEKSRVGQLENHYSDTIGNHYLVYIELTSERLYKQALVMKQICKLFPLSRVKLEGRNKDGCSGQYDQICNALLPQGLNPLSVPPKELAASLGYMVQLLNLVVHKLAVPALHNLGFGVDANTSLTLFYAKQLPQWKSSWTGRDTTNFGVTSLKSDGSVEEDYHDLDVINLSSASPHSVETFRNLQRGIAHLKQSVAHLTVYGYSSLSMEVPSGGSTFETFAKLLATLSSLKEVQSALSIGLSSSNNQRHEPNKSVWNLNSSSSSTLLNSSHTQPTSWNNSYYNVPNRDPSYMVEFPDVQKDKNFIGEWNLVEHPRSSHQPMIFNHPKKY